MTQQGDGVTGYDAIDVRRAVTIGLAEGTIGGGYLVTQRALGANMSVDIAASTDSALVQGDAVTAQGLYHVARHNTFINEAITSNSSGNPRVDLVVLEIFDNLHDGSSSNVARTRVIAGTATSGATLANLTGAASVPNSAIPLAYVLVANGAASISNSVILDARPKRRGKSIISATETSTSAGYGLLTTPDVVRSVVLPTDGLLKIWYQALWKTDSPGSGNARASIFIGSNQLKVGENDGAPKTQAATSFGDKYRNLHTSPAGLIGFDASTTDTTDVTTGQVVGSLAVAWSVEIGGSVRTVGSGAWGATSAAGANVPFGGPVYIFAAAGTYDISVQFKTSAGTISVKNRKLWVQSIDFDKACLP